MIVGGWLRRVTVRCALSSRRPPHAPGPFGVAQITVNFSTVETGSDDSGSDNKQQPSKGPSTIFSRPLLGGHGKRPGGLSDKLAREDEDLRIALENDPVGRAKMQCMAYEQGTPEHEDSFFRLMRFIVNSPRLLVCASKDGIMPFIAHGDWRKGEGRKVESVSAMVFTNDMLADMHGPSRTRPKKEITGAALVATLGQLLPHTPGKFYVNLNGVYEIPFPNKEIGAWMTNLRTRHLAAALAQESLDQRLHDEADAATSSASGMMIRDCATVEDAVHQFRDGNYFQVTVHGDPLVTQCDALGVVLPIFSTPVQAISFLQDIVDVDVPGSHVVTMDDVLISSVSGAKIVAQLAERNQSSNWLGGITLDPLAESQMFFDEETETVRRNPEDIPEVLLSRRDLRHVFAACEEHGGDDFDVSNPAEAPTSSGPDTLRSIGVFQSFDDAAAEGLAGRKPN